MPSATRSPRFRFTILLALLIVVFAGVFAVAHAEGGGAEPPVGDPPTTGGSTTGSGMTDYYDLLLLVVTVT